jgi:hypothetical protein
MHGWRVSGANLKPARNVFHPPSVSNPAARQKAESQQFLRGLANGNKTAKLGKVCFR